VTRAAATRRLPIVVTESVATAAAGGALAGAVWSLVDLAVAAAIVGALNGAIAGARGIYGWRAVRGWLAFALDSTWALITTAGSLTAHLVAAIQRDPGNYVTVLSSRRARHVYTRGYRLRRGFMMTVGNVVNGAGPSAHHDQRRQHAVEVHEDLHVWQARWFGPIFPLVYAAWWLGGALAAVLLWFVHRPGERFGRVVDAFGYYCNPFEWWAYSREGRWPPPAAVKRLVWRRPLGWARPSA
jgi:hypothetical protein